MTAQLSSNAPRPRDSSAYVTVHSRGGQKVFVRDAAKRETLRRADALLVKLASSKTGETTETRRGRRSA
ncbi:MULTISPECIES: hypothetical protein [Micrococcus]|uniref:Uncharacterized protein n=1 Tax=Micrococcus yunnanensis TaxID=566027 RepID=A0AAP5TB13_9MICC|nr:MULTISPECIES: hypothetical protein [Micrococcus]EZP32574.1 hypothetical protein BW36_02230 [Micrococcus luteus]MDV7177380.1 hypothetical protein [Micrococcus yunnanensis]QZY84933.1 hypothetical protein K7G68_04680 [Micrococcus luteus]WRQ42918.1 hypothetical protein SOY78_07800 [Micrococcus sp. HOU1]